MYYVITGTYFVCCSDCLYGNCCAVKSVEGEAKLTHGFKLKEPNIFL